MSDEEIDALVEKMLAGEIVEPQGGLIDRPLLTQVELAEGLAQLANWQGLESFRALTMNMCERCPSSDYFNRPQLKPLQDAYVLAEFARLANVAKVRLSRIEDRWPDGFVEIEGKVHNIEIVSEHGGRKLGEEYRKDQGFRFDPGSEWAKRARLIPTALDGAIQRKRMKHYGSPCWLVVYLNINEYGIAQREIESTIAATKAKYSDTFSDLAVLWKGKMY